MKSFIQLVCFCLTIVVSSFSILNAQTAAAIEEDTLVKPLLSITGSMDAYYRLNLNADFDQAPGTSFANLPGFSLGMANVILAHEGKKSGVVADLVFGPRGEDATFLSPFLRPGGNSSIVNQLYAYWNISDALTVTLGNFNTFLGYEVISPTGNYNYSTSYMFSYGPFSHTGLKFDVSLGGGFSLMAGIFNPTDATEYNPVDEYAGGIQLGYDNDNGLGVYVNTLLSDEYYQVDLTAGYDITDALYLGVNATTAKDQFFGVAGYLQYALNDDLSLGTRVEYFSDQGLGLFGLDESVTDVTLSANYTIGNLTLIPEIRLDAFTTSIIENEGVLEDNLSSFILAAVYGF